MDATASVGRGRPRKNDDTSLYDSPLYQVLVDKLPSEFIKYGRLDTEKLAKALSVARFTIYCWINKLDLSKSAVRSLLDLSNTTDEAEKKGALTKEDLIPFIGL